MTSRTDDRNEQCRQDRQPYEERVESRPCLHSCHSPSVLLAFSPLSRLPEVVTQQAASSLATRDITLRLTDFIARIADGVTQRLKRSLRLRATCFTNSSPSVEEQAAK